MFLTQQKSTNQKVCMLFKSSRHGMERIEIFDKDDTRNPKIITLENCVKITHEPSPANLIHIITKTDTLTLNTLTEDDLIRWLAAIQTVAFRDRAGDPAASVPSSGIQSSAESLAAAAGTSSSSTPSSASTSSSVAIEEDNDLYCSSYSDGIFTIKLVESEISVKSHLEARAYILHLTATDLQLKEPIVAAGESNGDALLIEPPTTATGIPASFVAKWPYRYIRKYGYRDGKFTFEAGRKCDTGEGVFSLEHPNPQEVFRCMAAKMKSMKKLISGDSVVSLDCGEHQFNAALSMEAGSRSPLPPSPNHHSHSESEQSGHLLRGFLSSNDSLNNVSFASTASLTTPPPPIPPAKHIPSKPPRKSIGGNILESADRFLNAKKYNKFQNYDPVMVPTDSSAVMGKTILLKTPPANDSNKTILSVLTESDGPPELPVRNESKTKADERDYECIETITNAWRTRGIDDVKHIEHFPKTATDAVPDFVWQRSQSQKDCTAAEHRTMMIIAETNSSSCTSSTTDDYDRLEYFKPKSSVSGDYKTIVTITPSGYKKQMSQVVANDYEPIGEGGRLLQPQQPDTTPFRLADDSFMGYGVLRKSSTTVTNNDDNDDDDELLDHRKYNGLEYAIVSKPKRV